MSASSSPQPANATETAARRRRELLREWPLVLSYGSLIVTLTFGAGWFADPIAPNAVWPLFGWLFVVILLAAFAVVHHAECLAIKLGEPFGTLILTLSVIGLEVLMISTIMLTKGENPEMARDTMLGVLMIVLNLLLGIAVVVGAMKHRLQSFNMKSSETYIAGLVVLCGLALMLSRYVADDKMMVFEIFLVAVFIAVYGFFLRIQTVEHRGFFEYTRADGTEEEHGHADSPFGVTYHAVLMVLTLLPLVLLAKSLSLVLDVGLPSIGMPDAAAGLVVATLILAPEGLAAVSAARHDNLQRAVNICLGSALATIGLTVPVVLMISWFAGQQITLGLDPPEFMLLSVTLLLMIINLNRGESNIMKGVLHLALFSGYVVFVFI
ncbi:MAG: calcium:proton antiporter [Planctomycetota bacterium]|nr:calcium:proton antiporter [Planctomycetota bacterium]MEE2896258.1 calcium:proton antiporter [Planctomycetota bacterium]